MINLFTGLVEEVGIVKSILKGTKSVKIVIKAKKVLEDIKIGDSISTNGICLTVTDFTDNTFSVDVMPETIRKSNLKNLAPGSKVNLERALRLGDRLGGHLVSGHIDGTGKILSFDKEDNAIWVTIKPPEELLKYIIYKGSIAIDGISLTVAYIDNKTFKVSIIPHTKKVTTLIEKSLGDEVNLECDMIGKYIEKFLIYSKETKDDKGIDMDFLKEHGFI
nr:riboflavin synthase [Caloranaerobacter ferrireducens]